MTVHVGTSRYFAVFELNLRFTVSLDVNWSQAISAEGTANNGKADKSKIAPAKAAPAKAKQTSKPKAKPTAARILSPKLKPTLASKLAPKPKATPAPKNDNKKKANNNGKNNGQAKVNGNGKDNNGDAKANGKAKAGSNGKANNNGNGKAAVEKKANGEAKANGNGAKTAKTEKAAIAKKSETTKKKAETKPQPAKDKTKANASPAKPKAAKPVVEKVPTKVTKTQKPVAFKPTLPLPLPSKPKVLDVNNIKSMSKNFPPFDKAAVSGTTMSSPEIPKKKPTNGYQQDVDPAYSEADHTPTETDYYYTVEEEASPQPESDLTGYEETINQVTHTHRNLRDMELKTVSPLL
ncbi:translation initiation factor IF-2-like [Sinocyclocheilus grahami]|uniref:translation initiation factor IF-2-like n=1 Tax=Sinocyclocheilus grahami TaxID=75366 RepID=UPI0007AD6415|nr:PREDICTED: translation initiation factor IF-2-like [Sinocyclocheilus grahami]